MKIPRKDWIWFGIPGHYVCADRCKFRMCTQVGKYLISTVGWKCNDKDEPEEIGSGRLLETMVFEAGKPCTIKGCNCGLPDFDDHEIEMIPYNTKREAQKGHMEICKRYANL